MFSINGNGNAVFNNNGRNDKSFWRHRIDKQDLHRCPRPFCCHNADRKTSLTRHLLVVPIDYHVRYWCKNCIATFCNSRALASHRATRCGDAQTNYQHLGMMQMQGFTLEPDPFAALTQVPAPVNTVQQNPPQQHQTINYIQQPIPPQPQTANTAQYFIPPQPQAAPTPYQSLMQPPTQVQSFQLVAPVSTPTPHAPTLPSQAVPVATQYTAPAQAPCQSNPAQDSTLTLLERIPTCQIESQLAPVLDDNAMEELIEFADWFSALTNGENFSDVAESDERSLPDRWQSVFGSTLATAADADFPAPPFALFAALYIRDWRRRCLRMNKVGCSFWRKINRA